MMTVEILRPTLCAWEIRLRVTWQPLAEGHCSASVRALRASGQRPFEPCGGTDANMQACGRPMHKADSVQ